MPPSRAKARAAMMTVRQTATMTATVPGRRAGFRDADAWIMVPSFSVDGFRALGCAGAHLSITNGHCRRTAQGDAAEKGFRHPDVADRNLYPAALLVVPVGPGDPGHPRLGAVELVGVEQDEARLDGVGVD